ncbi:MAG: hypothetical protein O2780_12310 [Proteobacteria bacterium]|nr:hypothetical protein [Pseudomonadota bacterium]
MNIRKLREAEAHFLQQYPDGFADPAMEKIRKSHNVDQLARFTQTQLTPVRFNQPAGLMDDVLKIISRSSMVSRFEKPAFRSFVESMNSDDKARFANALQRRLLGKKKAEAFDEICEMLARHKLAKWSLVSAIPFYFSPNKEAFVKPTTAKGIIRYLEIEGLTYQPRPTWAFYSGYCRLLKDVKKQVSGSLSPNNAALTGFLMMST